MAWFEDIFQCSCPRNLHSRPDLSARGGNAHSLFQSIACGSFLLACLLTYPLFGCEDWLAGWDWLI
jgi:hypothetical protein